MDFFKSKQTLHRYPTDFLIGDLLVKAGVISQAKLDEAIKLSGAKHLQLGQMLIMSGAINAHQLQCAVDAQSLVRDRTIDLNEALKVLKQACKTGQSLAEVMSSGHGKPSSGPTNKLGEVLLEAGLINTDQFSKAMQRSLATGLPLGRILVLNNTLADAILSLALDLQVRVRDDMLSRAEAIDALRSAAGIEGDEMPDPNRVAQAQAALKAPRKHGVRIGEMFVRAGLLTETDVMNALETGLATDQLIGQVLVGQGFITDQILEAALGLQKLVDGHHLDVDKAVDTLSMIQSQGITYDEAVESLHIDESPQSETISFDNMLVLARVLTETEIGEAFQQAMEQAKIVGQILLMTGHLDKNTLKAALRAHFLLQKGAISQDDAVVGLDYTMHSSNKLSFDGALQELGWDISNLPKDEVDPEVRAMEEARKDFGVTSDDELTKFVEKAKETSSATATTDVAPIDVNEELTAAYEPLEEGEIQIQSGTYDKMEPIEESAPAAAAGEEESWDVPEDELSSGEQEEEKQEDKQEDKPKGLLSGLLSHEDLEPVEAQEEESKSAAAAPKGGGKFANLLGGDEPAAKKSSDAEAKEKAAAAEKAEAEKAAAEKAKAEKEDAEKAAAEKEAKAKADKAAADRAAAEALAEEIRAAEKAAADKRAAEKAAADKAAAEKAAAEKAAAEKAAADRAAAEKAAAASATPPAAPAGAPVKKVGSFQSLLSDDSAPAKKPDAPAATPAAAASAASAVPVAAPASAAQAQAQAQAPTPAQAQAPTPAAQAQAPTPAASAAPAAPNVAAALSALTRAHPPTSGVHPAQVAPAGAASAAPPAAPKPPVAPSGQPAAVAPGQPVARPSIPAPVAAPGAAKPAPVQAPAGAPRPPAQAAPAGVAAPAAAHTGGPNGGGQGAVPPKVAIPNVAAPAPTAAVPAPAAAPAAPPTAEEVKDALSGAYARLAESYYEQGSYSEALNLYEKILAVREQELGESDPELVSDLANVVRVLCVQNRFDNAESFVRRIIGILEMTQPDDVLKLAEALNSLAQIYFQQNKFDQCLPVLERAVRLKQQFLGEDHIDMVDCYKDLARLMRKLNRVEEAEQHYSKAKALSGKGPKAAVV